MKKYIALKNLKPLLPIVKNNLLIMEFDSFKIFEDKEQKSEIAVGEKIKQLTFLILVNSVKDNSLFHEVEEPKYTKTDMISFYDWYSSDDGSNVFPNNEYISDAIEYWETNIKNKHTYAELVV